MRDHAHTPWPRRAYWVVPGALLAGPYPASPAHAGGRLRLGDLAASGVRTFLDLTHPADVASGGSRLDDYSEQLLAPAGSAVEYVRCPLPDEAAPTVAQAVATLDRIDAALAASRVVYLHCWAGRGRTGTIAGCWLARHGVAVGEGVVRELLALRRRSGVCRTALSGRGRPARVRASLACWSVGGGPHRRRSLRPSRRRGSFPPASRRSPSARAPGTGARDPVAERASASSTCCVRQTAAEHPTRTVRPA